MNKVSLTIDGVKVETRSGTTVLEVAREAGIYIPTLCSRPDLPLSLGECRLCVVDVKGGESRFPSSCITPVTEGMVVQTNSPQVREMRRHFLKAILSPLPTPRLKRPGIKSLADYIGVREEDLPPYVPRNLPIDREQPLFELDHNRCILCGLCVRICKDVRGVGAINFVSREGRFMIQPSPNPTLNENGCRFCGACVEVCPTGALVDKDDEWPGRDAGLAPCTYACPAGIDIPRYVHLVAQRRFAEAAAVIREKVPFPSVLGRVCFHPCEEECRRGQLNEPISIASLKRVAAERDAHIWHVRLKVAEPTGKRVAIAGSGPAGLTAGFYLATLGHSVTVFEALPEAGGMLRAGIPEYRLPREVLATDIEEIKRVGVKIKTNTKIESLDSLLEKGYDAVLLAIGTHKPVKLNVEGEDSPGVKVGLSFLRDVNMGKKVKIRGKVGVIGGGNVAIDAARTALRLGAKEVQLICLESREEMPAYKSEIEQAVDEGIILNCSLGINRIRTDGNKVVGVDCICCTSVFDKKGRFNPSFDESVRSSFDLDTVIVAIGQAPDLSFLGKGSKVKLTKAGTIKADADSLKTDMKGVFASGDAVSGPTSVIESIAAGRKAAISIDKYLGGSGVIDKELVAIEEPNPWLGPGDGFADISRIQMPCSSLELRMAPAEAGHFAEVEEGFTEEMAIEEAKRCLRCQLRFQIQSVAPPAVE